MQKMNNIQQKSQHYKVQKLDFLLVFKYPLNYWLILSSMSLTQVTMQVNPQTPSPHHPKKSIGYFLKCV